MLFCACCLLLPLQFCSANEELQTNLSRAQKAMAYVQARQQVQQETGKSTPLGPAPMGLLRKLQEFAERSCEGGEGPAVEVSGVAALGSGARDALREVRRGMRSGSPGLC